NEKAVIFTTYISTQQHLLSILEDSGFKDEVILFSGSRGKSPQAKETLQAALDLWEEEIGPTVSPSERPSGNILERTALVHYFKTRKKIFISTEAGAKGLNLQFCNVIINYDLPWNPQRIEQRIGRCHRYGQQRDVLVINCINADNETEQRIYTILKDKFSLFKTLMGAGDDILGTLSKAYNFEFRINDILNKCQTAEERLIRLEKLESEIDEHTRRLRENKIDKTRTLLDELDPLVQRKLKDIKDKLPESFSSYDKDLLDLLRYTAGIRDLPFQVVKREEEQIFLHYDGTAYYIGKRDEETIRDYQHIDLKHPLVEGVLREIKENTFSHDTDVCIDYSGTEGTGEILKPYIGRRGRWDFYRVTYAGFEEEERLYDIVCVAGAPGSGDNGGLKQLLPEEVEALRDIPFQPDKPLSASAAFSGDDVKKYLDDAIQKESRHIQELQQPRIDKKIHNMEIELKDMEEYLRKEEAQIEAEIAVLDKKINATFDREEGQKLLEKKKKQQSALSRCRKDLLEFQDNFQDKFDNQRLQLMGKRFLDTSFEKIFTLNFKIR
ncbi:MAG: hypothetical protein GY950_22545, partial [bacterium]|nr:hypothetical protein [bacterium]